MRTSVIRLVDLLGIVLVLLVSAEAARASIEPVPLPQYGRDSHMLIEGGCERNAFGEFSPGFPDRYIDAGESVSVVIGFRSTVPLTDVAVTLRVEHTNGSPVAELTVLGSPILLGNISTTAQVAAFFIEADPDLMGTFKVDLIADVFENGANGNLVGTLTERTAINVDESQLLYSTDFPTGGVEFVDLNDDGLIDDPINDPGNPLHARYETLVWSDLTAGGTINTALQSPWNFDWNNGGFVSGLSGTTNPALFSDVIALWGEDTNYNDVLDGGIEDRDPLNSTLDQGWGLDGGCGWQTRAPASCSNAPQPCYLDQDCPLGGSCTGAAPAVGGAWHSGRISTIANPVCLFAGNDVGQCQSFETIGGAGDLRWTEFLLSPVVETVNRQLDLDGDPVYTAQILDFAWNLELDLPDSHATFGWELDNAVEDPSQVDVVADEAMLGVIDGPFGAVSGGDTSQLGGYPVFAPLDAGGATVNLSRVADNACFFEGPGVSNPPYLVASPTDGTANATDNGPIRNMSMASLGGPDGRDLLLEDLVGDTQTQIRGAFGMQVRQKTSAQDPDPVFGFGATIDDVVIRWREFTLVEDMAQCIPLCKPKIVNSSRVGIDVEVEVECPPGCGGSNFNIEYGPLSAVSGYGYSGHECLIGDQGPHTFDPGPGDFFFLAVANDGMFVEGSYGSDSFGTERPDDATDWDCSFRQSLANTCGD